MRPAYIALILAAAAYAPAATISYSNSATAPGDASNVEFSLPQFDSALGTLTGVTLTVNELSVQGSITVTDNAGGGTFNYFALSPRLREDPDNDLGFETQRPFVDTLGGLVITPGIGYEFSEGETKVFTITENVLLADASFVISGDFWSAYQGAGSIFFQVRNSPDRTFIFGDPVFDNFNATSFADMTVTYTYTPVPEPSTYGMILGGLALAGAAVRRRRKSA